MERVGEAFELDERLTIVGRQSRAGEPAPDFADEGFGQAYGVLVKEWRLLQRAVFVIDREDRIVYADYVANQMAQPDYGTTLAAAQAAVDVP
jgi:peroxiredoxin